MKRLQSYIIYNTKSVYCFDPGSDSPQSMWLLTGEVWPREFPAQSLYHFDVTKQMTELVFDASPWIFNELLE